MSQIAQMNAVLCPIVLSEKVDYLRHLWITNSSLSPALEPDESFCGLNPS